MYDENDWRLTLALFRPALRSGGSRLIEVLSVSRFEVSLAILYDRVLLSRTAEVKAFVDLIITQC